MCGKNHFIETERPQPRLGFRQFNRILIQAQQFSTGQNAGENFLRVTAIAQRAIHHEFAGLGREHFQNFRNHDGPVRAGGRLAGGENFLNRRRVLAVLLVFVREPARVFAAVTLAAFVRCGCWNRRW